MSTSWTKEIVKARVMDDDKHIRYAAGSPNKQEIDHYARYLPKHCKVGVVMGMTPELRNMAAAHCDLLISIDMSQASINAYKDWLRPEFRKREKIIHGDWSELERLLPENPGFIIGDGVFGNITPLQNYTQLLASIHSMLSDDGCFVTRQCLMPEGTVSDPIWHRKILLEKLEKKLIDEAEFGLAMRLQGYADIAYDIKHSLLDNKKVFDIIKSDREHGLISSKEYEIINRYFFQGINSLPSRKKWDKLLNDAGFIFQYEKLVGKIWYDWYPIYHCQALHTNRTI